MIIGGNFCLFFGNIMGGNIIFGFSGIINGLINVKVLGVGLGLFLFFKFVLGKILLIINVKFIGKEFFYVYEYLN